MIRLMNPGHDFSGGIRLFTKPLVLISLIQVMRYRELPYGTNRLCDLPATLPPLLFDQSKSSPHITL